MTHTGTEHWERQRGLLAAHLDGQLRAEEDAALLRHLASCAECQRELAAQRQVKALLHAVPTPAAPRSFTLPNTPETRRSLFRPAPGWARPLQQLGVVAAMIGVALLCASAMPIPGHRGQVATSAANAPISSDQHMASGAASAPKETATASAQPNQATNAPVPTSTSDLANTSSHTIEPVAPAQPFPILPVSGATLLVGGGAAAAVGSVARRRSKNAAR